MKTRIAILAACASTLILTASVAHAFVWQPEDDVAVTALPGINIVVKMNPEGSVVVRTQTDRHGQTSLKDLAPGNYVIEIDGKSLVAVTDKLAPSAKENGGSSLSVGGSQFGGSSHRSRSPGDKGHSDKPGLIAELGWENDSRKMSHDGGNSVPTIVVRVKVGDRNFSSDTPYRRDTAGKGIRIRFTVRPGARASTVNVGLVGMHIAH